MPRITMLSYINDVPVDHAHTRRIAVVEDSHFQREHICSMLEGIDGCEVSGFTDVGDCLLDDKQGSIALFVIDYALGNANGIDLVKCLRSNPKSRASTLVMLTSATNPEIQWEAFEAGVDLFLTKPVKPKILKQYVRRLLDRASRNVYAPQTLVERKWS